MPSTLARKAAVISAVEQLVEPGDFQSIMITQQGSSGDYSVALVTRSLVTSETVMTRRTPCTTTWWTHQPLK